MLNFVNLDKPAPTLLCLNLLDFFGHINEYKSALFGFKKTALETLTIFCHGRRKYKK